MKRITKIAAATVLSLAAGVALFATHDSMAQAAAGHFSGMHDGQHLTRMASHIEAAANATPAQKVQIDALVAQATTDFQAMRAQHQQGRQAAHAILVADTIDRAQLEAVRVQQMTLADQASRRAVQLMADVGDVLTPEQRRSLGEMAKRMHGAH